MTPLLESGPVASSKGPENAQTNKSRNKPNKKAEKTSRALRSSPHRNSSAAPPPEIRRNRLRPRGECFSHNVDYEGDTVHVSFVVIKADTPWHYSEDGVDLVVKDPNGNQVHDSRAKVSDKFEFIVQKRGVHRFCFTNKSPYHETVDFDVHVGHFSYFDQHAKDEHFGPLFEQIRKLDDDLYNVLFEQHWLTAQTDRQAILNENMSTRAIHKALLESAALIAASAVQVYLLRRLFERKLGTSRV
ncbi:Transmembrane emp24 domain-containing protein 7 [Triticum urartu]|uniref:Transmembrane emp24 domain-containing protein 7 n=1 Tax=Triticum urartu TaxID=4572 RepID=M7YT43_TRIUA|nr:Transmembrane emp24 domain-containing protein 7 [Triticum urartu]